MKKGLSVAVFIALSLAVYLIAMKEKVYIIAREPTEIMVEPYPLDYAGKRNTIIQILNKGEKAKVVNYQYGKDFMIFKVQYNEIKGYILLDPRVDALTEDGKVPRMLK